MAQLVGVVALALLLPASALGQLTIRIDSAPPAPDDREQTTIYLAGTFNGWNPAAPGYAFTLQDGAHVLVLPDSVRGAIEFKFTLGSWETVETTATGEDIPNRRFVIPRAAPDTLTATVGGWRSGPVVRSSTRTASVHILSDSFPMTPLGRTRRIWIYLPPDYEQSQKRYPVLYMHDGQNVFDDSTSFAGEWGVDETLDSLHADGDHGIIVVAVDHGQDRRFDEYNPWVHEEARFGGGDGDAYIDFLVRTLKPYVDRRYRTRSAPMDTGIMGSSMGGLISLYAALRHPEVFGRAGVFSCACWVARPHIYATARATRPTRPTPRFYFIAGALETPDGEFVRDQGEVVDSLLAAGFPPTSLRATIADDGRHSEWFWRREFPAAYHWLFGDAVARKDRRTR